jgi:exopolysaccharide biosynthesis protein
MDTAHRLNRARGMIIQRTLAILAILSCATAALADWKRVAPGVDYQEFAEGNIDVHVARIDLSNEQIRVIGTREAERGLKVSDYAKKTNAIVAINGDYFDDKFRPIGLTIGPCGRWDGTRDTRREGFIAVGEGRATISRQAEVVDPPGEWMETAISGWPVLVNGCEALSSKQLPGSDVFTRSPHPRTAVGLSRDRKTLYLVVADGRRTGVPGLTLAQLADFMASRLRVCSAINFDGGGSAAMWVGDRIVNRPSDGVERKVSNHLAVVMADDYVACDSGDQNKTVMSVTVPMAPASATTSAPPR